MRICKLGRHRWREVSRQPHPTQVTDGILDVPVQRSLEDCTIHDWITNETAYLLCACGKRKTKLIWKHPEPRTDQERWIVNGTLPGRDNGSDGT